MKATNMKQNKNVEKALELRNKMKKKKPEFLRNDHHKKSSLGRKWRRPSGLHAKMRLLKKGYRRVVSQGYRSPVIVRGFHKKGKALICATLSDVEKAKAEGANVVIYGALGQKKRLELFKKAKELDLEIINVPADYEKKVEDNMKARKDKKDKKAKKKEKKKPVEKGIEKKIEEEKPLSEEEQEKKEQKEKDKVLVTKS